MILYLDTSALLKLYVDEPHSGRVRAAVDSSGAVTTHLLAYAEMRAAFARALRLDRITRRQFSGLRRTFERDWLQMEVVIPTELLIRRAGDLAEEQALRGYDSIHLAAAESVRIVSGDGAQFCFVAFDAELERAAIALGLPLLNADDPN